MKRCSTCNRTYTDPNLSFCVDDGTPLTTVNSEDEATVVSPRESGTDNGWNTTAYRPPSYVPPPGQVPRRRRGLPGFLRLSLSGLLLSRSRQCYSRRGCYGPGSRISRPEAAANLSIQTARPTIRMLRRRPQMRTRRMQM